MGCNINHHRADYEVRLSMIMIWMQSLHQFRLGGVKRGRFDGGLKVPTSGVCFDLISFYFAVFGLPGTLPKWYSRSSNSHLQQSHLFLVQRGPKSLSVLGAFLVICILLVQDGQPRILIRLKFDDILAPS